MSIKAAMVALVVAMVLALAAEQSQGLPICNVEESKLMTCLPAVKKANPKPPTEECCKAISGVDMQCMCKYKDSKMIPLLGIDLDLCMEIPKKCGLGAPTCHVFD